MNLSTFILGAALFFGIGFAVCAAQPITLPPILTEKRREFDAALWLDAVAGVETDSRPWRVGQAGERGRCQIMHTTWVRYTNANFFTYAGQDCEVTRKVEMAHLNYLRRGLFGAGNAEVADLELLAASWRWETHPEKNLKRDYTKRVVALYLGLVREKKGRP